ncbi:UNVERIFIED_CONTAM: G-type lectin S-receptor-like serine/threonine-protein kinase [Sesamum angustifolium]|uniref:Receptor-like serine/threonine-protein kinase n=1 Tax=Sesamum angustifolium TaxID=2727405 RepID=A0AAW2LWF7_9LAMI
MEFLLFLLNIFSLFVALVSGVSSTEYVYPNFTASNLRFVDAAGSFLSSTNGTFKAAMFNPGAQQIRFYLCVIHTASNTIIWSANRDSPVSESGIMSLTANGISVSEEDGSLRWSTPPFKSLVSALKLTETGNLVLLDQSNNTLWESFRNPTDTIVIGQELHTETELVSAVSSDDLSTGRYRLGLTVSDATLQWENLTYWKLSMDTKAYVNSNYAVEFMAINRSGLYLFGQNGSAVIVQVNLPPSEFRIAKMDDSGQFIVSSFSGAAEKQDFVGPLDECRIPFICGKIGLCSSGISANSPVCSCPLSFRVRSNNISSCVPADSSYSLPASCNSTDNSSYLNSSSFSYLQLGFAVDYFANDFTVPANYGVNLSQCQDICSQDCTCLGVFYDNSTGSCYKLENELGSMMVRSTSNGRLGFIKTVVGAPRTSFDGFVNESMHFPVVAVVLPLCGILFFFLVGILLWRRYRLESIRKKKRSNSSSSYSGDLEFSISGLPLRFEYEELMIATENFKTKIGTGGFGTVYKGTLPDKTHVAVKRITNLGRRGKKDFCTEIAVIGNIHHVNLVKLKGYCAQRRQWLLVYEYMNRGSLDKTLFGSGPVLEWQERVDIALGAARGLAYLHSGCEHKIVHCDVKPENILLHDHFQAKISDFGLSKLLNREESSLFTTMRGTRGYLAPEWLTSSTISDKTDVYSFGMVLLEIVSGRKNCVVRAQTHSLDESSSSDRESSPPSAAQGLIYFPLYALEMHEQGRYLELVDPRLQGRVTNGDVEKLVRVALCCVHEEPGLRPTMVSVVGMLEGEIPLGNPRIESLNFLRFYGRQPDRAASMAEETGGVNDVVVYPDANASHNSTRTVSDASFSYISSQQISGPR